MPALPRYNPTEQTGINTAATVFAEIGWIFRPQPVADMGIDAHVEIVDGGAATGKLFALQIKSGESYFRRDRKGNIVFTFEDRHMNYWDGHSLPVFVVLHNPNNGDTIYCRVLREQSEQLETGWKIHIPPTNKLDSTAIPRFLEAVSYKNKADKRRQEMALHAPIIQALGEGTKVFLETEDWCNKTLKRGTFKFVLGEDEDSETIAWDFYYAGMSLEVALSAFFPWAKFSVDHDFYEANHEAETCFMEPWQVDDYGEISERFGDQLYPYDNSSGEVDLYRLSVSLNALGNAYILTENYILTGELNG